jgi:hypothetical protein
MMPTSATPVYPMPRGVGRRYARGLDATPLLELGAVVLGLAIVGPIAARIADVTTRPRERPATMEPD